MDDVDVSVVGEALEVPGSGAPIVVVGKTVVVVLGAADFEEPLQPTSASNTAMDSPATSEVRTDGLALPSVVFTLTPTPDGS